jgi:hypothetical protein
MTARVAVQVFDTHTWLTKSEAIVANFLLLLWRNDTDLHCQVGSNNRSPWEILNRNGTVRARKVYSGR